MPAVTVDNILTLPRIPEVDAAVLRASPGLSVTTAPKGFEGEGFPVRRAFAGVDLRALDPFIHMDQMGEVEYAPGEPKGTAWHPHRGFETVTYIIDGEFAHSDSNGGGGLITNGDTQWMTAGAGILHIEVPPEHLVISGGLFHGFQLWVNLPKSLKFAQPRYQDIRSSKVSLLSSADGGALLRVIAGELAGHPGPGVTHTPINLVHATLSPGASLTLPWRSDFNALAYVLAGKGTVGYQGPADRAGPAGRLRRGRHHHDHRRPAPGHAQPEPGRALPRRPADPRAGRRVRPVRHEHQGRAGPGVRGLPGWPAGHDPGRAHVRAGRHDRRPDGRRTGLSRTPFPWGSRAGAPFLLERSSRVAPMAGSTPGSRRRSSGHGGASRR